MKKHDKKTQEMLDKLEEPKVLTLSKLEEAIQSIKELDKESLDSFYGKYDKKIQAMLDKLDGSKLFQYSYTDGAILGPIQVYNRRLNDEETDRLNERVSKVYGEGMLVKLVVYDDKGIKNASAWNRCRF